MDAFGPAHNKVTGLIGAVKHRRYMVRCTSDSVRGTASGRPNR